MQRRGSQRGGGLGRSDSQSHRDKSKHYPQELGPQTQPKEGTSYYLVVCGATNPEKDHYVFSDFMGYCYLLQQKGIGGDFYNCLDLDKCFGYLSKINVSTIAFGVIQNTTKPLLRYSRFQHVNREYFFQQIEPDQILDRVALWIREKWTTAIPGDVVNIIIECHGSKNGLKIGSKMLVRDDAVKICDGFVQGVQVNFITGACHSGIFTDAIRDREQKSRFIAAASSAKSTATAYIRSPSNRTRNSRFSQAFVQSLSRIVLPGVRRVLHLTIGDHNEFMKRETYRSISGLEPVDPEKNQYQSYVEPDDLTQLVEQMVFREKVDVIYDPKITSSRRRLELPTLDPIVLAVFAEGLDISEPKHPEPERVKQDVRNIIAEEKTHCNPDHYMNTYDVSVFDDWWYREDSPWSYGDMIQLLYWRGRIQVAVMDVFHTLVTRGLISSVGLSQPIDIADYHKEVQDLAELLCCFTGTATDMKAKVHSAYGLYFDDPLQWLVVLILRGFEAPIHDILDTIMECEFLGELDRELYAKFLQRKADDPMRVTSYTLDPNVCLDKPGRGVSWGFWLPCRLQTNDPRVVADAFDAGRKRFNAIEKCFRDWFGLTQEQLLLEEEQAEYFSKYPEREPGYRLSGAYPSPESQGMTADQWEGF
jgi:hypothetical protein